MNAIAARRLTREELAAAYGDVAGSPVAAVHLRGMPRRLGRDEMAVAIALANLSDKPGAVATLCTDGHVSPLVMPQPKIGAVRHLGLTAANDTPTATL